MRKNTLLFCVMLVLLVGCATVSHPPAESADDLTLNLPPYSGEKISIAVMDLQNQSEFDDPRIGRGISKMLITALVNSDRFTVVERNPEALQQILNEQKLGLSGIVNAATAAKVGQLLGVKGVVIGEVSEFGIRKTSAFVGIGGSKRITTRVVIDARLVDVETGRILLASTGIGTSSTKTSGVALSFEFGTAGFDETTIGIATRKAVNQIVKKFAAMVDTKRI